MHLGRLLGPVGFSRTVAIKRLHGNLARDPEFVSMFLDEARLAARIQHPNVIQTLDVVAEERELFIVMEYVEGESISRLLRSMKNAGTSIPPPIVGSILVGALYGLHAAHEAKSEQGEPLGIIHRDVSPQNVLVGVDGVPRVLDFGVAKAAGRAQQTMDGQLKGKLAYMSPEQMLGEEIDRRADVYSAGVVLWETLATRRLFEGENQGALMKKVVAGDIAKPSSVVPGLPHGVDAVVAKATARRPEDRFASAWEMALAVEEALGGENVRKISAFVESCGREAIARRTERVRQLESMTEADLAPTTVQASPLDRPTELETERVRPNDRAVLMALAITAGLGVATALALVALVRTRPEPGGAPSGATATATSTESAVASAVLAAPAVATVSAAASTMVVATTATTSVARPTAAVVPPAVTTSRTSEVPPVKPPAGADCIPPFVIVNGKRKLKPECI